MSSKRFACTLIFVQAGLLLLSCSQEKSTDSTQSIASFFQTGTSEAKLQRLTADCMKQSGFTYIPDSSVGSKLPGSSDSSWKLESGYGVAESVAQPLLREGTPANMKFMELSSSEQGQYMLALFGLGDGSTEGCYSTTRNIRSFTAINVEIQGKLSDLEKRVDADPKVRTANQAWSRCMAEQGWPGLSKPSSVVTPLLQFRSDALQESAPLVGVFPGSVSKDIYEKILAFELKLARVDVDCSEELDKLRPKISEEYEEPFIEENQSLLNKLKDASGP